MGTCAKAKLPPRFNAPVYPPHRNNPVHQSYRPTLIATLPFSFGHAVRSVGDDRVTLTRTGGRAGMFTQRWID